MENEKWNGLISAIQKLPLDEVISSFLKEAGVQTETNPQRRGFLCPFHDDHSGGHAGIYTDPQGRQRFHCFVCGTTLDVFGFVMRLKHISYRQAVCEIAAMFSLMTPEEYQAELKETYTAQVHKSCIAVRRPESGFRRTTDRFLLNTVYKILAKGEMLKGSDDPLSKQDREYLHSRGISDWEIQFYGYFTMPDETALPEILKELKAEGIQPEDLYGVPGFFHDVEHDCVRLSERDGVGIPLCDEWRRITAIQVRDRNPQAKPRYKYLSSRWADGTDTHKGADKGCGPASTTAVLFPYVIDHLNNGICITEGVFKAAQFAQELHGIGLSVQGVNNTSSVLPTLEGLERRKLFWANGKLMRPEIWLAFDMDMYQNVQVFKAAVKLRRTLEDAGWHVKYMSWNPVYKGLDDFLIARRDGKHPGRLEIKDVKEFEESVGQ